MLIDKTELYNIVWNMVYEQLGFNPSVLKNVVPFEIAAEKAIYGIEDMSEAQIDEMGDLIWDIFVKVTLPGERMFALDWHHSAFLYNPRDLMEQKDVWVEDGHSLGGGYMAYFPPFFPDGDYYFFIDEKFRFGYLGHPWRQEVWIFGDLLLPEFEKVYAKLGWRQKNIKEVG